MVSPAGLFCVAASRLPVDTVDSCHPPCRKDFGAHTCARVVLVARGMLFVCQKPRRARPPRTGCPATKGRLAKQTAPLLRSLTALVASSCPCRALARLSNLCRQVGRSHPHKVRGSRRLDSQGPRGWQLTRVPVRGRRVVGHNAREPVVDFGVGWT